jgi:hypothetical protein
LFEVPKIKAKELLVELYEPASDQLGRAAKRDSRRPKLTMLHLQKLRISRDVEKYDKLKHLEFLPDMYGQEPQSGL